jgi:cytochrome P450
MDLSLRHSSLVNLFDDSALDDPYPLYRQLRDSGPAVWLLRYDVWFLGRWDVVRTALHGWETWSSACGIGLNPVINEAWKEAAQNPAQWRRLREEPGLAGAAFNETVRMEAPIQGFSRLATRDVDLGDGVTIPAGARAIVSCGSANRDGRHFENPDRFDIDRRPLDHLGFGFGVHNCAGQHLARMEAQAVFSALARRVHGLALRGPPQRALNSISRGYARIPMRTLP